MDGCLSIVISGLIYLAAGTLIVYFAIGHLFPGMDEDFKIGISVVLGIFFTVWLISKWD